MLNPIALSFRVRLPKLRERTRNLSVLLLVQPVACPHTNLTPNEERGAEVYDGAQLADEVFEQAMHCGESGGLQDGDAE